MPSHNGPGGHEKRNFRAIHDCKPTGTEQTFLLCHRQKNECTEEIVTEHGLQSSFAN